MTLGIKINKIFARFIKFAKVGIFITLLSMGLSFLFLKIIGTPLIPTYIVLYLAMIFLSFVLNSFYTFKAKTSGKRLIQYYVSYGFSMLLGVALLAIFRRIFSVENWILAYMVLPFTLSSNFFMSSIIFKEKNV